MFNLFGKNIDEELISVLTEKLKESIDTMKQQGEVIKNYHETIRELQKRVINLRNTIIDERTSLEEDLETLEHKDSIMYYTGSIDTLKMIEKQFRHPIKDPEVRVK